ncbi:MAG: hypothetical protein IPK53_08570 [bacterium]|nr:hypothetical protein [bacterium]
MLGLFKAEETAVSFTINGGSHTCHPTYIDDAVARMLLALQKGAPAGVPYHRTPAGDFPRPGSNPCRRAGCAAAQMEPAQTAGNDRRRRLELLAKIIRRQPPLSRTGVAFFSEDRRFSWQKAHTELGYTPQFDLPRGVAATAVWYRENELI